MAILKRDDWWKLYEAKLVFSEVQPKYFEMLLELVPNPSSTNEVEDSDVLMLCLAKAEPRIPPAQ